MRTPRIGALEVLFGLFAAACTSDSNGQQPAVQGVAGTLPCDVAHLLEQHCVMCHGVMPKNGAPHSLLTAGDFQKDEGGQTIGQIAVFLVQNPIRRMPPPPNAPLTADEIGILQRWIASGAAAVTAGCGVQEASGAGGAAGASGGAGAPAAGGATLGTGGATGGVVGAGGSSGAFAGGAAGIVASGGTPPTAGGAAGAAGAVATGGASPLSSNWNMFGGDLGNSRTNAASHLSASSLGSFHRVWQFQGAAVTSTPAVVDGVVYFSGWDAKVYAVHAADGTKVWTTAVPHLVDSSPSVTADRVFVGDNNGIVSALDRATGSVVWSKPAETVGSPHLWSSPIVLPDVNLVVAGVASAEESNAPGKAFMFRGSVSALDAATGAPRWQFYTSNNDTTSGPGVGVWSTACVDTALKLLYIGSGNAYQAPAGPYTDSLLAIHYDTGKLEWAHQFQTGDVFEVYTALGGVDSDVGSSANLFSAGGKDLVGVGVKNGIYYALDRKTGTVAWQRKISAGSVLGGIMGASAYANGVVFVAGNEGMGGKTTAMALNAADGSVLWTFSAPATTYAALAVAGGVVYLGTTGGGLYGIDAATGKQLWTDKLPDATAGGVSIGENLIFAPWGFYFTLLNGTDPGKGGLIAYGP